MADRVLLSAGRHNAEDCVRLACDRGLGVELMIFAYPDILDGDWRTTLAHYRELIKPVPGPITLHGPFLDMVSGSLDPRINAVCTQRYSQALRIASQLEAERVVFHANFIGSLHNRFYREGWQQRSVEFWSPIAEFAQEAGVAIGVENMWEFDPTIIADLLREVNHPYLRTCLDVGHAHLFSEDQYTFDYWLETMLPWLDEVHMNNNNGMLDEHYGFDWQQGVLQYHDILPKLREANPNLHMVLEMNEVDYMAQSLHYFKITEPA